MSRIICHPTSPLRRCLENLEAAAPHNSTVLLLGESGSGKELCARHLHEHSARRQDPFVALNCASLTPGLLGSELFGHEKGAFTGAHLQRQGRFEAADGGTLFLDEVGELPLAAQAALLRVLQERKVVRVGGWEELPVDIRLVAATHRDLWSMAEKGTFRHDLFFRLHVVTVKVPPLRERSSDLPLLVSALLSRHRQRGLPVPVPTSGDLGELRRYHWPGNVRELENLLERWAVLGGTSASLTELMSEARERSRPHRADPREQARSDLRRALERHGGHREMTARELGITRRALTYRLSRLGMIGGGAEGAA